MKLFNFIFTALFIAIVVAIIYTVYNNYNIKTESKIDKKKTKTYKNTGLKKRLNKLDAKLGDRVFIRLFKKENLLEVWIKPKSSKKYKLLKSYDICYYSGSLGPKLKEGDRQAPEGFYRVYKSSLNPNSKYHLSFNLGYPNKYDRARGRTGSFLMIHGGCSSTGCYAMGNKNIEEIYSLVKNALYNGQKYVSVHIFPFRLSEKNLNKYKGKKWYLFWQNLKEGYDFFEEKRFLPNINVKKNKYIISAI